MTFEEKIKEHLESGGFFEPDLGAVIEFIKNDSLTTGSMGSRWNDDPANYPPIALTALLISVDSLALDYIDANLPLAWFRSMFVRE